MATAGGARGSGPERAFVHPLPPQGEVALDAEESSHLVRARRVRVGEPVVLFDGRGMTLLGQLVRADPRRAVVRIEGPYADREPRGSLTLCVSLPEGGRTDRLVGQLAELGVDRLMPLRCARTPAGRMDLVVRRRDRWAKLAREAAKSSGRSRLLEVLEPHAFADVAIRPAGGLLLLDPDPSLPLLPALLAGDGELPWIAVGPEGGFTAEELEASAPAARARLGATALRTETAALAAAAVVAARG